jgi:hypothetical protein
MLCQSQLGCGQFCWLGVFGPSEELENLRFSNFDRFDDP